MSTAAPAPTDFAAVELHLRTLALAYPEATEDFPWGERVIKVKKKVFVFMGVAGHGLSLSVKLPHTGGAALAFPFTQPTGYGLGKSGWVSATFPREDDPPYEMLREWVEESYRAVAPAKLAALVGGPGAEAEAAAAARPAKRPARRTNR